MAPVVAVAKDEANIGFPPTTKVVFDVRKCFGNTFEGASLSSIDKQVATGFWRVKVTSKIVEKFAHTLQ